MRVAAVGVIFAVCGTLAQAQQKPAPNQKPDATAQAQAMAQQQEVQNLVRLADTAMSGQQAPAEFPIQFQNDFLRAQGSRVWVPIVLTIDPAKLTSPSLGLYLRVVPRGMTAPPAAPAAAPAYPYEDVSFLDVKPAPGQPARILRGIGVPAGSYDLYIVLHERAAAGGKTSVLKQPLDVPNYAGGDFATSTVILAERVDQLQAPMTPEQQSEHPYAFGATEIVVSPDHKFKKSQELIVLLQIYNQQVTPEKKFNLEATYTFYKTEAGVEKRFNATEPQVFSSDSMGAGFDPSSGNSSIQAGQGVPLQSFPEGTYRLEIKITDKLSAKVLTQNVNFTVTP